MFDNKTIAVVVPAYNEGHLIGRVIDTMPDFVDRIIVVNDKSQDSTHEVVRSYQCNKKKVDLIDHEKNQGVGGAIITGYKKALEERMDVTAVMAGDAQMDPDDLARIIEPIVDGVADYTKGNRLFYGDAWNIIPHYRYLGNSCLSLMTKIASGYWHIADSQSGYTAISLIALQRIDLDRIYKRYGMPNDILIELNLYDFRVRDIHIRPVYNIGERSGIKLMEVIPKITWILLKGFWKRLVFKYVIKDFHPLIFFYILSFILLGLSIPLTIRLFFIWAISGDIPDINAMALIFTIITGLQSLFFGMWFDMEKNKDLK
ncbi:MAG: glycosyltransferase family 2 protein [Thermodesulfobacteriota bacterium]|nr:glycosyltransferase family 2 protein [Thermodesulfobacteriota bacterium]